jgi:NADH-quinone oxidoreductase subunit L
MVVAVIGAATAIFAATIGLAQNDIKRVLAYSTVSQLGYMVLACGVAAFAAGIFHLMTHAFFKALLFMAAGSVIHAMAGQQDMRYMGGLKKYLPVTFRTMYVATLAIAGIPLFSGFFSKDEILWKSLSSEFGSVALWVVGFITAGLTAFYMFRLVYMTFYGKERMDDHTRSHLHESPKVMTVPLVVLAILSVIGGYVGLPHIIGAPLGVANYFEHWLEPVIASPQHHEAAHALASQGASAGLEWGLMALTVAFVRHFYRMNTEAATRLADKLSGLKTLLVNKYYVDELYSATIVRPVVNGSLFLWTVFDVVIIDGFINGLAVVARDISDFLRFSQGGRLRGYATLFAVGVVLVVAYFVVR